MFHVGDTVVYGSTGVCTIADIRPEKFGDRERVYYVLRPENSPDNSTIYCPVDCDKVNIRRLISREEIHRLIDTMPDTDTLWIENEQQRRETYAAILKQGNREELVQLIRTLHDHREEKVRSGRKFHASDERILREAEKIFHGELAYVLNIRQDEVAPFILEELEKKGEAG